MKRLEMGKIFPAAYKLLTELDIEIKKTGLNPLWLEMLKIRASQLNGCAYCLNKHTKDAIKLGEKSERLYVLSAWREAGNWFSNEEQIILSMTEEITLIGQHGISDTVYDNATSVFGEETLAKLIMAIISINAWNRIGVGLNMHPVG
ncbi:MAG: carboxymuconolactone decarboxylase family protein [Mucilaginibacter sp.]